MNQTTIPRNQLRSHHRLAGRIARLGLDKHTVFLTALAVFIFSLMSLAMPKQFPTLANLESMAFQMSELGILALAMVLAMLIGGIDLSITAIANLSAILAGMIMVSLAKSGGAVVLTSLVVVLAVVAAMAVGLACGFVNGFLIGRIGVPAILATLGTLTLFTGIANGITKGRAVHGVPEPVLFIGIGKWLGLPVPLIIFVSTLILLSVILNRTAYGFRVYLLGSNSTAARFSGINNGGIILRTHMLIGALSALTGIVTLARTNSANADYGSSYLLITILIAVLGGVSVSGGSGRLSGVVAALMILQMISSGFNMLLVRYSGSNFFRDFAWGFLLLSVMMFTRASAGLLKRERRSP